MPTIKGEISVSHQLEPSSFTTTLNVPQHTKAVVGIPVGFLPDLHKIEVNGILVWKNGKPKSSSDEIDFIGLEGNYIKFEVSSGNWNFKAVSKR